MYTRYTININQHIIISWPAWVATPRSMNQLSDVNKVYKKSGTSNSMHYVSREFSKIAQVDQFMEP